MSSQAFSRMAAATSSQANLDNTPMADGWQVCRPPARVEEDAA